MTRDDLLAAVDTAHRVLFDATVELQRASRARRDAVVSARAGGVGMSELARRLGVTRGALYQMLGTGPVGPQEALEGQSPVEDACEAPGSP